MYMYNTTILCFDWLRTNGVKPNEAAAEVTNLVRLGEKGAPWHFWEDKHGLSTHKAPLSKTLNSQ